MPKLNASRATWARRAILFCVPLALVSGCEGRSGRNVTEGNNPTPPLAPLVGAETLVGAGDIAGCASPGDEETAILLDSIPGTVFTAGDNVYPSGTAEQFRRCYEPSWGRHRARTYPIAGNHDYRTNNGAPYYAYFGARAGEPGRGYYSFMLGDWLVLMLNSNIEIGPGSEQLTWMREQLASHPGACEIVMSHHPRFSSGPHGRASRMSAAWRLMYEQGVEFTIGGHDHLYERFAPMDADGRLDSTRGVRQFVVGTGGFKPYAPRRTPLPNSQVRSSGTNGLIKLSLGDGVYQWQFVPVAGKRFTDWGQESCRQGSGIK